MQYYTLACPPTATQYAIVEGMKIQDKFHSEMISQFRVRRDVAMRKMAEIPTFETPPVRGAFYVFPRYSQKIGSEEFALRILKKGVICAPGDSFGSLGEGHLRFSYANSEENIETGLDIVKDVAATL